MNVGSITIVVSVLKRLELHEINIAIASIVASFISNFSLSLELVLPFLP